MVKTAIFAQDETPEETPSTPAPTPEVEGEEPAALLDDEKEAGDEEKAE